MMRTFPGVASVRSAKSKKNQAKKIILEEYRIHLFNSIPDVPNDLKSVRQRERLRERRDREVLQEEAGLST
jgi:hypothetical protein